MRIRSPWIPRFSILSLLLMMVFVALAILLLGARSSIQRLQLEAAAANQKMLQLERANLRQQAQMDGEFLGVCGPPIIAIDPRLPKAVPRLLSTSPSRWLGQGKTFGWGLTDQEEREVRFELRLLRSIDKRDYYRLSYSVDSEPGRQLTPLLPFQKVLLFEYDGKSKLLLASDSLIIAIAPDQQSCIEATASAYSPEEAEKLRQEWLHGLVKPLLEPLGPS